VSFSERLDDLGWVTDLLVAGSLATGDYVPGVRSRPGCPDGGPGTARQEILAGLHRELDQGAAQGLDLGCVYVDAGRLADLGALHPMWTRQPELTRPSARLSSTTGRITLCA
jgi:hypothetical protein